MSSDDDNENNQSFESIRAPTRHDVRFKLDRVARFDNKGTRIQQRWTSLDVDMQIYLIEEENGQPWLVGYHGQEQFARMILIMRAFQHQLNPRMVIIQGKTYAKRGMKPIFRKYHLIFLSEKAARTFAFAHNVLCEENHVQETEEEAEEDAEEDAKEGVEEGIEEDAEDAADAEFADAEDAKDAADAEGEAEGGANDVENEENDSNSAEEPEDYDCYQNTQDPWG